MKKSEKIKRESESVMEKIRSITRHIRNVQDNCLLLGEQLIMKGELDLGKQLIANGFVHDVSKFGGIEFEFMSPGTPTVEDSAKLKLKMAVYHHGKTNAHHPEFWSNGIKSMPKVFLAECVCDWKSRSEEFGTSLRDWIDEHATKRFNFNKNDVVYREIYKFVDLLCPPPFENLAK